MHAPLMLAETPAIDPAAIVIVIVIFVVLAVWGAATVVVGVVAGFRYGRDPSQERARVAWWLVLGLELLLFVLVAASAPELRTVLWLAVPPCMSVGAWAAGSTQR